MHEHLSIHLFIVVSLALSDVFPSAASRNRSAESSQSRKSAHDATDPNPSSTFSTLPEQPQQQQRASRLMTASRGTLAAANAARIITQSSLPPNKILPLSSGQSQPPSQSQTQTVNQGSGMAWSGGAGDAPEQLIGQQMGRASDADLRLMVSELSMRVLELVMTDAALDVSEGWDQVGSEVFLVLRLYADWADVQVILIFCYCSVLHGVLQWRSGCCGEETCEPRDDAVEEQPAHAQEIILLRAGKPPQKMCVRDFDKQAKQSKAARAHNNNRTVGLRNTRARNRRARNADLQVLAPSPRSNISN